MHSLRALESDDPQEAAWAAEVAYSSTDYYVKYRLELKDESAVLAHPIVQAELARQRRDLEELLEAREEPHALFTRLLDRAKVEAQLFLPSAGSDSSSTL